VAEFLAVWTLELTKARRIEWNTWARAHMTKRGLPISLVVAKERSLGWTTDDLKRAVKAHNL
jgi:hypothetical protein